MTSTFALSWAPFRTRTFWIAAAVSVVTMPLTAIWFLLLGAVILALASLVAVARRSSTDRARTVATGISLGAGLLVGPAMYLALALLQG